MDTFEAFKMGIDILWSILTADPLLTGGIIIFIVCNIAYVLIVNIIRERRLKKSGIQKVDKMSGKKFEEYLQVLLKTKGYYVELTPYTGDYGVDLILSTKGKKIIVPFKKSIRGIFSLIS